jgi:membrane associated rhomboid family serine protease
MVCSMTNIVDFKKPKQPVNKKPETPPFINLPPVTKFLLIAMIVLYGVIHFIMDDNGRTHVFLNFGFIPALWTGQTDYGFAFDFNMIISPITYIFLHANFMHIAMNGAMLMAFGAGVEKWMGARKFIEFFILCAVASVVFETIIHPASTNPVIGASGAESGLFAAILILLQSRGQLPVGQYGIWPFVGLWIGISLLFGLFGGFMAGGQIAWAAHIGGFFAGLGLMRLHYFKNN